MARRARFERAMTAYVDERAASRQAGVVLPHARRPLDLAYRAEALPPRFGRLGQAKLRVAEELGPRARAAGLRVDVSLDARDAILGNRWFPFVASARAVLGSESGASAIDRRGELVAREERAAGRAPGPDLRGVRRCHAGGLGRHAARRRSAPATSRRRSRSPRRCWWRATTTACWSRTSTTCPCAPTSPTRTPSSSAWATTRCSSGWPSAPTATSCSAAATATPRSPRASRRCWTRSAPSRPVRRTVPRSAAPSSRRAPTARSSSARRAGRTAAVDRVAPGVAAAHPRGAHGAPPQGLRDARRRSDVCAQAGHR